MAVVEVQSGARREVAVFALVGLTCAAVNFGVGAALRFAVPIGVEWPSVAAGFLAGTLLSFVLNRRFTFGVQEGEVGPQAVRFAVASIVSVALSAVVATVLDGLLRAIPAIPLPSALLGSAVHVATIGVMFVFNFFAMKYFALRA
jgi:putative flippase GtrA